MAIQRQAPGGRVTAPASVSPVSPTAHAAAQKGAAIAAEDKNAVEHPFLESLLPALPPVSGGQLSPPRVPWVGHKQLDKLKASREHKSLDVRNKRSASKAKSAPITHSIEAEQSKGLSTQGNSYSHDEEQDSGRVRKSPSQIPSERRETEQLAVLINVAMVKPPKNISGTLQQHENAVTAEGPGETATERNATDGRR